MLRIFARILGEVVISIVQAVEAPASFVAAFATNWSEPSAVDTLGSATSSERLASSTQLVIWRLERSIDDVKDRSR